MICCVGTGMPPHTAVHMTAIAWRRNGYLACRAAMSQFRNGGAAGTLFQPSRVDKIINLT